MPSFNDFEAAAPAWCPGCGNFSILKTFKQALVELGYEPHQLVLVSGIGQAGKFPHYLRCNMFNGLHGRSLPVAAGVRLANHRLPVFAVAGDGDCYGEGGNHLMHAMRRNLNITLMVHNNQVYGLTKGQASPTTGEGTITKNLPFGVLSEPLNPMALAVALDCSFVARGFAGQPEHLKALIKAAALHKGFALLDILQPCVSFNKVNTYEWYADRVAEIPAEHDPADRVKAFELALQWGDRIPIGLFYRNERATAEDRIPVIQDLPLVKKEFNDSMLKDILKEYS